MVIVPDNGVTGVFRECAPVCKTRPEGDRIMNQRWLFRMAKLAKHPPSEGRVKVVLAILAVCLLIAGVERFIGLPEFLKLDPVSHRDYKP